MFKYLFILIGFFGYQLALAQAVTTERTVLCGSTESFLKGLSKDFGEEPLLLGKGSNNAIFGIFFNTKTKTYTALEFNDKVACILSIGDRAFTVQPSKNILLNEK